MQQIIGRVIAACVPKRPVPRAQSEVDRNNATQIAARLLDRYRADLARRSPGAPQRRPS